MYSHLKQIERLLTFVKEVAAFGCSIGLTKGCIDNPYVLNPCIPCKARQLLNDEPVRLPHGGIMETGEGYPQEVKALENPAREGFNPPMSGMKV